MAAASIVDLGRWEDPSHERAPEGGGSASSAGPRRRLSGAGAKRACAPPSVSEHAASLVAGLTRGLAGLTGSALEQECVVRRSEVLEGIGQILHVIDATDQAVFEAGETGISSSERDCYAGRLRWSAGMCSGLQRGVEALVGFDHAASSTEEYNTIAALLGECGQRLTRLSLLVGGPGQRSPQAAAVGKATHAPTEDRMSAEAREEQMEDYVAAEVQRAVWQLAEFLKPAGDLLEFVVPLETPEIEVSRRPAGRRTAGA